MPDPQITGMEPTAFEGLLRRLRILQITLHRHIAAHKHFAHALPIHGDRFHRLGIGHHHGLLHLISDALAGLQAGLFIQ